jgi:hypothetical protein
MDGEFSFIGKLPITAKRYEERCPPDAPALQWILQLVFCGGDWNQLYGDWHRIGASNACLFSRWAENNGGKAEMYFHTRKCPFVKIAVQISLNCD